MNEGKIQTAAIAATVSVVAGLLLSVSARAAAPTGLTDTLDRLEAGVNAAHTLSMTLPVGGISTGNTMTVTYLDFSADFSGSPAVACGAGTATAGLSGRMLTLTGGAVPCTGTLLVGPYSGTNPAVAGSTLVEIAGSAGIATSYAIAIVGNGQVAVSGTIEPYITFNVGVQAPGGANCDGTFNGNGGTLALGTVTSSVISSSDVGSVNHICTRISTNATDGASVMVRSSFGALRSGRVPAHTIPSATGAMLAGTANYGLCASDTRKGLDTTVPAGAPPVGQSPYNGSCPEDTAAGSVGALTVIAQTVWTTAGPTADAFHNLIVKAAVSRDTPPHDDYADTLTFIAVGTF